MSQKTRDYDSNDSAARRIRIVDQVEMLEQNELLVLIYNRIGIRLHSL
jgi:hypothetical protein